MAQLKTDRAHASPCCSPAAQESCCEPGEKAACCGRAEAGGGCGCAAGAREPSADEVRESVRERYAAAAVAARGQGGGCGCGDGVALTDGAGRVVFGGALYSGEVEGAAEAALDASLGCGVPTAGGGLRGGGSRVDLRSGAGADGAVSAGRGGAAGRG